MLDTDTRRKIDTARDILVGKVPDPKSQVEQITIALIYKFMDDIDAESEELGGGAHLLRKRVRPLRLGESDAATASAAMRRSTCTPRRSHECLRIPASRRYSGISSTTPICLTEIPRRSAPSLRLSTSSHTTIQSGSATRSSTCCPSSDRRETPGSSEPLGTSSTS